MKNRIGLLAAVAFVALSSSAQAATLSIDFGAVYVGPTPGGPAPWANVTLVDNGADTVDMTISHSAGSAAGQFISELMLNLDPFVGSVSGTAIAGKTATYDSVSAGSFTNAGTTFDLDVHLNTSNSGSGAMRLLPGDFVTIRLVGTGLAVANFDALSTGGTPVRGMMHMQALAGGQSTKLTEGVPEPASMLLLAAGVAGIAARRRKS